MHFAPRGPYNLLAAESVVMFEAGRSNVGMVRLHVGAHDDVVAEEREVRIGVGLGLRYPCRTATGATYSAVRTNRGRAIVTTHVAVQLNSEPPLPPLPPAPP